MRASKLFRLSAIALSLASFSAKADGEYSAAYEKCAASATVTEETQICNKDEQQRLDKKLNEFYKNKLNEYTQQIGDTTQIASPGSPADGAPQRMKSFKKMEQDWIRYRDSFCGFAYWSIYPGSFRNNYQTLCQMEMTAKHLAELEQIINLK